VTVQRRHTLGRLDRERHCNTPHCNILQHTATHYISTLWLCDDATLWVESRERDTANTLQLTTLQHNETQYNTLRQHDVAVNMHVYVCIYIYMCMQQHRGCNTLQQTGSATL